MTDLNKRIASLVLLVAATTAVAEDRRVNIINETDYTIVEFHASNVGAGDWQEDILGKHTLLPGGAVVIDIDDGTGYCKYDLLAVFEDGDTAVQEGVDVCEIESFRFTE